MNNGKISIRYARALYAYAVEHHEEKAVYEEMQLLASAFTEVEGFRAVLTNPALADQDKAQLLEQAVGGPKASESSRNFLRFALEKKRGGDLQMIALMYCKLYREAKQILVGQVTSAVALDAKTLDSITAFIRNKYQASVEMTTQVDPSLIGGFILDVEDNRLDASISGQLQKLNNYARH